MLLVVPQKLFVALKPDEEEFSTAYCEILNKLLLLIVTVLTPSKTRAFVNPYINDPEIDVEPPKL